jgi:hypothetical protein
MISFFKNIFLKNKKNLYIDQGSCYAVLRGDYVGEIFVFFKQEEETLFFVSIPKMVIRKVDWVKLQIGLKDKIVEFINILPKDVYKFIESHGNNLIRGK